MSYFVDAMNDNANKAYSVTYERLYIVLHGVCVYAGGPGPCDYYVEEVLDWLAKFDVIS